MAVYVDDFRTAAEVPNGGHVVKGNWSHLMADTRAELDAMADRIGLRRVWIQHPGEWLEHYDVTDSKRKLAIRYGAIPIETGSHQWADVLNRKRRALGMPTDIVGRLSAPVEVVQELDLGLEEPPTSEVLSPGVRLTQRRRIEIERGRHPATHEPLIRVSKPDDPRTCGDCGHRRIKRSGGFTGSKCTVASTRGTDGPDIVQKWPACVLWIPREEPR